MAPNRIPESLTELANGLTIPAMKPFTCRKLARPILEDPSTRKTISAACTLLHLPANTSDRENMWAHRDILSIHKQTHKHMRRSLGADVVIGKVIRVCFCFFYLELQHVSWRTAGWSQWKPSSTFLQPGHKKGGKPFYYVQNYLNSLKKQPDQITNLGCNAVFFILC